MENSLFGINTNTAPAPVPTPPNTTIDSNAVLEALIKQGVGNDIKQDSSLGKRVILNKLAPKTRGLKRLIKGLEDGEDALIIRGADDAVDVLEVLMGIVDSKFVLQNGDNTFIDRGVPMDEG